MGVSVAWPRTACLLPATSTAITRSSTRRAPSIAFTPTHGVPLCEALPRTVTMTSTRPLLASATWLVVPMTITARRGRETKRVANADRGVMAAGLARSAHREHEAAAQGEAVGGSLHRRERRGERAFLLGHAAAAHMRPRGILDQLAGIGFGHAVRRMGHGIGHQHQALVGTFGPEFDQEIAHRIAPPRQAERLHQGHHLLGNEALHLRLVLEAFGLRAGVADEGTRPLDDVVGRDAQMPARFAHLSWLPMPKAAATLLKDAIALTTRSKARSAEDPARRGPRTIPPWRQVLPARSARAGVHRAHAASTRHRNAGSRSCAGLTRR